MTYRIYLCGGETGIVIPNPECPRSELHTPCRPGYMNWHAWASARHARGSTQSRCPGCGLFNVWSPERRINRTAGKPRG